MTDTKKLLRSLGFSEAEANVYLAGLKLGPSSAIELAKATNLARQTVYEMMDALEERALMTTIERGGKRVFVSEHPEKLLAYVARREHELHELKSDLERNVKALELQMGGDKPIVHVFEGKEGVAAILEDIKNDAPNDAVEITDVPAMQAVLSPEELAPVREELIRKGVRIRGLYDGPVAPNAASAERYVLPKDFGNFKSNITVYGDKIALITFEGKMNSVIIESAALAKAMRVLFDLSCTAAKQWNEKSLEQK